MRRINSLSPRKRRLFEALPRHKRRDEVIRLKNLMRRDCALFGGRFISRTLLEEGRDPLDAQACICYFPGRRPDVLWNALIRTAREAFWDAVGDAARGQARAMLGPSLPRTPESTFERLPGGGYTLRPPERYEAFGGLTMAEKVEQLSEQIIGECPPPVRESFRVRPGYTWGIGLEIVVDAELIDRALVERLIDRFQALGETDWEAPCPVPADHLPTTTWERALRERRQA